MQPQRTETDVLGALQLPAEALYGIHSLRGKLNFPYSGETLAQYPRFVAWLARVKLAVACVHRRNGAIGEHQAEAIALACSELIDGKHTDALIVDPLEGSCGTSINMNLNEVIANRALQAMGHAPGNYTALHPLDHVNLGQSTSDVLLTAVKLALLEDTRELAATVDSLAASLRVRQQDFDGILRIARTCLQDALPMRLGQAFGGYASLAERGATSLRAHLPALRTVCLGATAVGTGLGTSAGFRSAALAELSSLADVELTPSVDLVDSVQNMDEFASLASSVKTVAMSLAKVANDLVLLSSGPNGGIGEVTLAPQQAGSSMMPGKVNPVHAMGLTQIAYYAAGAEQSIMLASAGGQLETNNYMPLIAFSLFKATTMVRRAVALFDEQVVRPLRANRETNERHLLESTAIAPVIRTKIGYERTAALVAQAVTSGRPLIDVIVSEGVCSENDVLALLRASSLHPDAQACD